jgi:hypothetical protein
LNFRFLAIVLPSLTLCTHTLLVLSAILPGADITCAFFTLAYNALAGSASILGLVGAIRLQPCLVSAYTALHTITLTFATIALVGSMMPFEVAVLNPVVPSYRIDESSICRDMDVTFGWEEAWFVKCIEGFAVTKVAVACFGFVLMAAQWWALWSVKSWGNQVRALRRGGLDVEKTASEKNRL